MPLYHTTARSFANRIKEIGLETDFPLRRDIVRDESEYEKLLEQYNELQDASEMEWKQYLRENENENYGERIENFLVRITDNIQENEEEGMESRDIKDQFDHIMRIFKPAGLPNHDSAVFFWKQPKSRIDIHEAEIVVNADHLPCQCYEVPIQYSNAVYSNLVALVEKYDLNACLQYRTKMDTLDHLDDMNFADLCRSILENASDHYKNMIPYNPSVIDTKEVMCPCNIPKELILNVRFH